MSAPGRDLLVEVRREVDGGGPGRTHVGFLGPYSLKTWTFAGLR
jgi:hypothetical protein